MIQSMTGFGKGIAELPNKKIIVEIKSLNSKQLDLSTRIPPLYKEKEMEIRSEIARRLERGKVDLTIRTESIGGDMPSQLNVKALQSYYEQINNAAATLGRHKYPYRLVSDFIPSARYLTDRDSRTDRRRDRSS